MKIFATKFRIKVVAQHFNLPRPQNVVSGAFLKEVSHMIDRGM